MPRRWKKKPSTLIKPLYTYVTAKNDQFVRKQAEDRNISYSEYVDSLITSRRKQAQNQRAA